MPPTPGAGRVAPLLLTGPTAAGKSEVAILLAEELGGEIVSVDSMQVYRGMDIGTAKPSASERARVRHHLIDLVEVTDSFDAAQFVQNAQRAIFEIEGRGKVPVLCGGTGFYFKALLRGLGSAPRPDTQLRAELEATPLPKLLAELQESDPATFERIDRHNPRRVVRALEVIRLTGRKFSEQRADWAGPGDAEATHAEFYALNRPKELRNRIDARVEQMFQRGLVEETKELIQRGLNNNLTGRQALGYRQVREYLEGRRSLEETMDLVKLRTRQFAKRQMTWFRHQLPLEWIEWGPGITAEQMAAEIVRRRRVGRSGEPGPAC